MTSQFHVHPVDDPAERRRLEAEFEISWTLSWYARYKLARSNFANAWTGPAVPVEVVELWKHRDWLDLLNGAPGSGVPPENTYRRIIDALESISEDERKRTNFLCGAVPMTSMPMYDRPDGPYWRATRAHNVLHKDVRAWEEGKLGSAWEQRKLRYVSFC